MSVIKRFTGVRIPSRELWKHKSGGSTECG